MALRVHRLWQARAASEPEARLCWPWFNQQELPFRRRENERTLGWAATDGSGATRDVARLRNVPLLEDDHAERQGMWLVGPPVGALGQFSGLVVVADELDADRRGALAGASISSVFHGIAISSSHASLPRAVLTSNLPFHRRRSTPRRRRLRRCVDDELEVRLPVQVGVDEDLDAVIKVGGPVATVTRAVTPAGSSPRT